MKRIEETEFVWALVESANFLSKRARAWLCVQIGAGEPQDAIKELLEGFARTGTPLPVTLSASMWAWVNGFVGSENEAGLRDLASQITLSVDDLRTESMAEGQKHPRRLVAQPSNYALRRKLLSIN